MNNEDKKPPTMVVIIGASATIITLNRGEQKQFAEDVTPPKPTGDTYRFRTGFPSLPIEYSERFVAG